MISNPCQWFSGGSHEHIKEFTYEGGTILFHFSTDMISQPEFERYQFINVVFFANDEKHAVDVLIRMIEFYLDCSQKQSVYYNKDKDRSYHAKASIETLDRKNHLVLIVLDYLKTGRAVPEKAPTDQLFKVGWACNDTLF